MEAPLSTSTNTISERHEDQKMRNVFFLKALVENIQATLKKESIEEKERENTAYTQTK